MVCLQITSVSVTLDGVLAKEKRSSVKISRRYFQQQKQQIVLLLIDANAGVGNRNKIPTHPQRVYSAGIASMGSLKSEDRLEEAGACLVVQARESCLYNWL